MEWNGITVYGSCAEQVGGIGGARDEPTAHEEEAGQGYIQECSSGGAVRLEGTTSAAMFLLLHMLSFAL